MSRKCRGGLIGALVAVLLLAGGGFARADSHDTIMVIGKAIPRFLTPDPSSRYHSIFLEAAHRAGLKVRFEVAPGNRALTKFNNNEADVLVPVKLELMNPGPFTQSVVGAEPFMVRSRFIFTPAGSRKLKSVADLDGLRVGLVRGFRYGRHIDQRTGMNKMPAGDVRQLILLMRRGRIDAFVAFPHAVRRFAKDLGGELPDYDPHFPVTRDNISYAFHDTERGRRIRDAISRAIIEMREDETLGRMMKQGL